MYRNIGIGEYLISDTDGDKLRTFALGSCVAVILYCPARKVMGMVHVALPNSKIDADKGRSHPGYFADLAVPLMLEKICGEYSCTMSELEIRVIGGAKSLNNMDSFQIGPKNMKAVTGILEAYNLRYDSSETGGHKSRTVEAHVSSGLVRVTSQPLLF